MPSRYCIEKKIFAVVEVCDRWFYIFNFNCNNVWSSSRTPDMKCAKILFPIRTVLVLFNLTLEILIRIPVNIIYW